MGAPFDGGTGWGRFEIATIQRDHGGLLGSGGARESALQDTFADAAWAVDEE